MSPDVPDAPDPAADSAGQPWAGRTLTPSPFAGDDGSGDPSLLRLLDAAHTAEGLAALVAALPGQRLFAALLAELGEAVAGHHGQLADKQADMALVSVHRADGRRALPLFTSVATLQRWHPQARPIPVEARRAALAGIDDGCQLLLLDPDPQQHGIQLPRPATFALAQGEPWTPALLDPQVHQAIAALAQQVPPIRSITLRPGTQTEVEIVVELPPGLSREQVQQVVGRLSQALANDPASARLDSVRLALR